ncbi:MAG: RHS repeat domain-containing protein [Bacteroidota bacterium]
MFRATHATLVGLYFLLLVNATAQTVSPPFTTPPEIPPSPNAASLGKYGNMPVSHYAGIPTINIPLYELKHKDITLPVSLSYHASGIKVSEIASWVGLGWSLNGGGTITRYVRGLPDEIAIRGYLDKSAYLGDVAAIIPDTDGFDERLQNLTLGYDDMEPDVFSFNFAGYSGQFVFNRDRQIVLKPHSNLKVIPPASNNRESFQSEEWIIMDDKGYSFHFGGLNAIDYTNTLDIEINPSYSSAWHLTKIVSPSGNEINLTYQPDWISHDITSSYTDYHKITKSGCPNPPPSSVQYSSITFDANVLSEIKSDLVTIQFVLGSRSDISDGSRLTQVNVIDNGTDTIKKSFLLNTSYFLTGSGTDFKQKRLRLDSFEELPEAGSPLPNKTHEFVYETGVNLPSRDSYAVDHWGYYNGKTSNTTFMPTIDLANGEFYEGANKEADFNYAKANILKRIIYPTKGYTDFNYSEKSYEVEQRVYESQSRNPILNDSEIFVDYTVVSTFPITHDQWVSLDYEITNPATNGEGTTGGQIAVLDAGDNVVFSSFLEGPQEESLSLSTGSYKLAYRNLDAVGTDFYMYLSFMQDMGLQMVTKPVGGVRIASIYDHDNHSSQPFVRSYLYEDIKIIDPIQESDYAYFHRYQPDPWSDDCTYMIINSSRRNTAGGNTLGYGRVTEYQGLHQENGKTVSTFSHATDEGGYNMPNLSREYRRGLLIDKTLFNAAGDTVQYTYNDYEFEQIASSQVLKIRREDIPFPVPGPNGTDIGFYHEYHLDWRHERSEYVKLNYTLTKTYEGDVAITQQVDNHYDQFVSGTKTYNLLTSQTTQNSKNQELKTIIKYAPQYNLTGVITEMMDNNMVNVPIEVYTILDNQYLTQGSFSNMEVINTGIVVPITSYTLEPGRLVSDFNASTYDGEFTIDSSYDLASRLFYSYANNPIQHIPRNGIATTYIWGYDQSKVIAVASNASRHDVAYHNFESSDFGNWNTAPTPDFSDSYLGRGSFIGILNKSNLSEGQFVISLYAKGSGNITVNGISKPVTSDWSELTWQLDNPGTVEINSNGNRLDEVRLLPHQAKLTTYSYEPIYGIISKTDANGVTTHFNYDDFGRLSEVVDKDHNLIEQYRYRYISE